MKPIVKWAGGKSRLLPELLKNVPKSIDTYVEPFAGGAALFFELARRTRDKDGAGQFRHARLADRNAELVTCYRAVRDSVEDVVEALQPYRYDRELYYATRAQDPKAMSDAARAARLLFLNRTCYNGLWRVNSKGQFNVPFGRHTNPTILDAEHLREASKLLAGVEILLADFSEATAGVTRRDFIYFDPPYVPVSKTADFTAYSAEKFGPDEQQRLSAELRALKTRGVRALLSNADTKETRRLYDGLPMRTVQMRRHINRDPMKRGDAAELIVMTWSEKSKVLSS